MRRRARVPALASLRAIGDCGLEESAVKTTIGIAMMSVLIAGCNSEKSTGLHQSSVTQVNQYLDSLPSWAQFSPTLPDQDPTPTGAAPALSYDTVASVTTIDSAGNTATHANVPYVCEATPYSVEKTPQDIVMYSPNAAILYPGAFIQGKSYKNGIGSLLPLNFTKRAPINVSIPAIQTGTNYRTVDTVDQAHVASAVGSIIGSAVQNNLQASSSIFWHMDTYYSDNQFALTFNASGHYLGFSASVGGSVQTNASQNTVVAHFYEKMFTVVVSPPSTPAGWFRDDFTAADLQQQVSLGNIGPDNLPVYIGEIVYGRMMMFSVTSTASISDIQASISASYDGLLGGGSASLSAEQKKILSTATIEMASVGGNDSATIAMIRSGNWAQYFTASAPLSTAEPLSYDFYNLADNTLAQVTEATSYNVTTCSPATAGQFDFLPAQSFAPPVPTPFETRLVDVNGDGRPDLVFNHRDATSSQVAVALASAGGAFATPGAAVAAPGTSNFALATGDFNGDGKTDLLWSYLSGNNIVLDVALADGSGGWTFSQQLETLSLPGTGFTGFNVYVGDIDGDGKADLIFNQVSSGNNYVFAARSNGDGTFGFDNFSMQQLCESGGCSGWSAYRASVADVNRDGRADLIFNRTSGTLTNDTYSSLSLGNGQFGTLRGWYTHPVGSGWNGYQWLVADVNGDQIPDMIWYAGIAGAGNNLYVGEGSASGPLTFLAVQSLGSIVGPTSSVAAVGDVDGDGLADVILYALTATTNTVGVLRGTSTGFMDPNVSPVQVSPVSTNWNGALPAMVGDVNGDGRADVVWVIPGSPTRVFVAQSRGVGVGLARSGRGH